MKTQKGSRSGRVTSQDGPRLIEYTPTSLALELESVLKSSLMSEGNRKACIHAVNSHGLALRLAKAVIQADLEGSLKAHTVRQLAEDLIAKVEVSK